MAQLEVTIVEARRVPLDDHLVEVAGLARAQAAEAEVVNDQQDSPQPSTAASATSQRLPVSGPTSDRSDRATW
jgi:hypothetical protein